MHKFPFCPNPECSLHHAAPENGWYSLFGTYTTKTFGVVLRFRCRSCRKTFSVQTFSLHYYAKKIISLPELEELNAASMGTRALARHFHCTCNTISNRIDRLMRQGLALHSELRPRAQLREPICFDGLVNFDHSQFFPNDIGISIGADSQYMLALSHASVRRSGTMTDKQKELRKQLYATCRFEPGAVVRSVTEHLDLFKATRSFSLKTPLLFITDEKHDYVRALYKHPLFVQQDETHRIAHLRVNSKLPRTLDNRLFASNYIDRETRKDQANFRRETTCVSQSAANCMSRLSAYMVHHNYAKLYRIKTERQTTKHCTHAEVAGIARDLIESSRVRMFSLRAFVSHLSLAAVDYKIWAKQVYDARVGALVQGYLPKFALQ